MEAIKGRLAKTTVLIEDGFEWDCYKPLSVLYWGGERVEVSEGILSLLEVKEFPPERGEEARLWSAGFPCREDLQGLSHEEKEGVLKFLRIPEKDRDLYF